MGQTKMELKSGTEFKIMMSGRNTGKSYWTAKAIDRLMKDLLKKPVEDLMLSEGTVYGARYHCVEPIGGSWLEMEIWCSDTFGETGSIWSETKNLTPEPLKRWYMNNRKFWFRNERDRTLFIMRWSSQ